MPVFRCACPACRRVMRVPDDMDGKRSRCPGCGAELVIRAMGGKTLLQIAGVAGDAPTLTRDEGVPAMSTPAPHADKVQAQTRPAAQRRQAKGERWRWGGKVVALFVVLTVLVGGIGAFVYYQYVAAGKAGSPRARQLYQQALAASQHASDAETRALLNDAIADSPDFAPPYALRAGLVLRMGARDRESRQQAFRDAEKCVQLDPDNADYRDLYYRCKQRRDSDGNW